LVESAPPRAAKRSEFELGLFLGASGCLPREVNSRYGTIRLARQQLAMGAELTLFRAALEGSIGLHAGATSYDRWTVASADGVSGQGPKLYLLARSDLNFG
jgi:hypothetical protein